MERKVTERCRAQLDIHRETKREKERENVAMVKQ